MTKLSLNASQKTKHTPAGEIPVDWACVKMGDVIRSIKSGVSVNGADHPALRGKAGVLKVSSISSGYFQPQENKQVNETEVERTQCFVKKNTILFSRSNTPTLVGASAFIDRSHKDLFLPDKLWEITTEDSVANIKWLAATLASHSIRAQITIACSGSSMSMKNISQKNLFSIPIPLPPLPEQKKIAKILNAWDRAIETQQALIAAKTEQKRSLMQRFTSHRNNPKWTFIPAEEIFENRSERNTNNEPILSAAQDRGIVLRSDLKRKIQAEQSNESNYKLVYPGDFVISLRSFQGGLEFSKLRGAVSPAYHIIQPRVEINRDYYRHYFKSREFIERLSVAVIGIRDGKQIAFRDFSFLKLPHPPIGEQHTIAKVLNVAEKELILLTEQLETLREQKRGLMQSLLTGKVRVKV